MPRLQIGPYSTAPGPRRRYKDFQMWAEDGLVFLEDQKDGEVTVLTQSEGMFKLQNFSDWEKVWDKKKQNADPEQRAYAIDYHKYMVNLVEALRETLADAKAQGDPTDQAIRKHKMRSFLRSKQADQAGREADTTKTINALFDTDPTPLFGRANGRIVRRQS